MTSDPVAEHKKNAPRSVGFGLVTLSNSRGAGDDTSGDTIRDLLEQAGHSVVVRSWIRDDPVALRSTLDEMLTHSAVGAVVTTGGTGLSLTDITIETVRPLFEKELKGFQSLFAQLSYNEVGGAAMLSRATAGVIRRKVVFCLPGSPAACRLAIESLLLPEIGHILKMLA